MKRALATMTLLLAGGSWQATAAVTQPNTGKTSRAVTASTSRPLCHARFRLIGSQRRGFLCVRRDHGPLPYWVPTGLYCQRHYEVRQHWLGKQLRFRCVPTHHKATPPPPKAKPPTTPPPPPITTLTVANICSINPRLGAPTTFTVTGGSGVYWIGATTKRLYGALNFEGDNKVDVAFVLETNGVFSFYARCYPHETPWIRVPQQLQGTPSTTQSVPSVWDIRKFTEILTSGAGLWGPISPGPH